MDASHSDQTKRSRKGTPVKRVVPPPPDVPPATLIAGYMTFLDLYKWCAERLHEEKVLHYLADWKLCFASDVDRPQFAEPIVRCVNAVLRHTRQGLSIGASRVAGAGNGLFTDVARGPADGPFAVYGGIRMTDDYYLLHNRVGAYLVRAGDGTYIDGELCFRLSEPARWANTTGDPVHHNVVLFSRPGDACVMLLATRDIAAGEELYCDYGPDYVLEGGGVLGNPADSTTESSIQCIICGRADVDQRCTHCHSAICTRECFARHAPDHE
jgi:hypothetical protein